MENIKLPYSPYDLLPIINPQHDKEIRPDNYFYENVIKYLIPDIIKMQANGIPIDISKVSKVEKTVDDVITIVHDTLKNNSIMLKYLQDEATKTKKTKKDTLEGKKKVPENFIKEFSITNKIHRTYVVNQYLVDKPELQMNEWSIKDLRKLNQVTGSTFITNILNKTIEDWMLDTIKEGMLKLADEQCTIYNKNRIDSKIEALDTKDLITAFNPGSAIQKQNFFKFYGIESEKETKKGNPQWDREEIERLQKLLGIMIDDKKEQIYESK